MILYLPRWLWSTLLILICYYCSNFNYKSDVLYIVQAILTAASIFLLIRNRNYLLSVGLLFIMVADLSYYIQLYKLNLNSNNINFYLSTSVIYSIGFILIAMAIYQKVKNSIKIFIWYKISVVPVIILIGATISFLFQPLLLLITKGDTFNFNTLATITEMSTSIPLIVISYLAIILSFDLADACFAIGILLIGLVDWGIQYEFLTMGKLAFSYFDFFWFFGLLLVFSRAVDPRKFQEYRITKSKSLRIQLKILTLLISLLPVGLYYWLSRSDSRLSISFFLIGSAVSLLVASIVVQYFSSQLLLLTSEIEQIFRLSSTINGTSEVKISEEWEESLKIILKNKIYQDKLVSENENALLKKSAELAAQISHDIRSPLSALNMIIGHLPQLQEEQRILIRNSVQRINDIANCLLEKSKTKYGVITHQEDEFSETSNRDDILIGLLVDTIVSEKRVQYRDKSGMEIEPNIDLSEIAFVKANATELKRVLSNIINNSVEAIDFNKGKIIVTMDSSKENVTISVEDNGKGMPSSIREKLMVGENGVTYGKVGTQSGSGIGIYHAKKTIESFGGKLEIESEPNCGTRIAIILPRSTGPSWFVEKLELSKGIKIVALDDDYSIHNVWQKCFNSKEFESKKIELTNFVSVVDFESWVFNQNFNKLEILFLVDYELLGQNITGLDLIEKYNLNKKSILVTSHYDEVKVINRCKQLNVKLLPKSMAGFIKIVMKKPKKAADFILIDDDELIHAVWALKANEKGLIFSGFRTVNEFMMGIENFELNTPIYLDSDLGINIKGEEFAQQIYKQGFTEIHLCTGYNSEYLEPIPWIKSIVSKEGPFES